MCSAHTASHRITDGASPSVGPPRSARAAPHGWRRASVTAHAVARDESDGRAPVGTAAVHAPARRARVPLSARSALRFPSRLCRLAHKCSKRAPVAKQLLWGHQLAAYLRTSSRSISSCSKCACHCFYLSHMYMCICKLKMSHGGSCSFGQRSQRDIALHEMQPPLAYATGC